MSHPKRSQARNEHKRRILKRRRFGGRFPIENLEGGCGEPGIRRRSWEAPRIREKLEIAWDDTMMSCCCCYSEAAWRELIKRRRRRGRQRRTGSSASSWNSTWWWRGVSSQQPSPLLALALPCPAAILCCYYISIYIPTTLTCDYYYMMMMWYIDRYNRSKAKQRRIDKGRRMSVVLCYAHATEWRAKEPFQILHLGAFFLDSTPIKSSTLCPSFPCSLTNQLINYYFRVGLDSLAQRLTRVGTSNTSSLINTLFDLFGNVGPAE